MWSVAELNIAIICACIPLIRPLIKVIFPKWFRGSSARGTSSNNRDLSGIKMGSLQRDMPKRKLPTSVMEGYGSSEEALATPGGIASDRDRDRDRDLGRIGNAV